MVRTRAPIPGIVIAVWPWMLASAALAWGVMPAVFAEDSPVPAKPDPAARIKCVKAFLSGDPAKRKAALAEAAKWPAIPAGEAIQEIDLLRKYVPKRTVGRDAKKQPVLRGVEKWNVDGKEFEYQWAAPKKYDGSRPTPMLIYLHGSNGPQGIGPWDGWAASQGAILVAPTSPTRSYWHPVAGATDPQIYQEGFFFTFLEAWREKFNVDWDRVYLSGFSAGGFGSWWFALRYPDWWAAVMPMAGGPPADWGQRGPYEHVGKLPFYIWHGEQDKEVPPDLDRSGVEWLRKLGTPCDYTEYPGGDHNTWFGKDPKIGIAVVQILEVHRRISCPKRVVWTWDDMWLKIFPKTGVLRGAWWLEMTEHGDYARLEGEVTAPNVLELRTKAVKAARILAFADLFDLTRPVEVKWDGKPAFQGVVDVDFALLMREFAARPDPHRLVLAEIRVAKPGGK